MFGRQKSDEVRPADVAELQRRGAVFVDVREDDEWMAGHTPDAVHVPPSRVGEAASRFADKQVLTVCRSGARSGQAAKTLAAAGVDVHNVAVEIIMIETKALGDRSYVIVDGDVAAAVDPQRDIDRIEGLLAERRLRLTHVFEAHVHNDYVTGGLGLSRMHGATYVLVAEDDVAFEHTSVRDGDEFTVAGVVVRALHTPGHTPHHLSYAVVENGNAVAVFTGGSLLYGTVGRTDLINEQSTEPLTRAQFHSVRRLADELPGAVAVHPTHGFGSFCSSASTSGTDQSTIPHERLSNLALTVDDEDIFVARLLAGLTAYPRYYAHMAGINRQGPAKVDLSPPDVVDPVEIRRRIHQGDWIEICDREPRSPADIWPER